MKYDKKPLSFDEQADRLLARGIIADRDLLVSRLHDVNYYRLSAYWYPFRQNSSDALKANTTFERIWRFYTFDRRLRLLVIDAIERFEVSIRTRMTNAIAMKFGAFGYVDPKNLPGLHPSDHDKLLEKIRSEESQSKETFVKHFREKYAEEHDLPIWMACELLSIGTLFTIYRGLEKHVQADMAAEYRVPSKVLSSWLMTLNYVRNLCAHHARLWNRELAISPLVPRGHTHLDWNTPVYVLNSQRRLFAVVIVLKYVLNLVAPQSKWPSRFDQLLADYPDVPLDWMGFPKNWSDCPIWKRFEGAEKH
ncbi:MAG: Abi family protein [Candidatus Hydrogenedentales bacterium]|jgi:abortive infection bacteriophage resistance protein